MSMIRGSHWGMIVLVAAAGCGGGDGGGSTRPDASIGADAHVIGTDANVSTADSGVHTDGGSARSCVSPSGECDLLAQDCPADSEGNAQVCVYALPDETATTAQTVCAPMIAPGGSEGDACCALNSCDVGLVCRGQTQTGSNVCSVQGTCQRYCCGSSSDCDAGQVCNSLSSDFSGGVCADVDGCDLVDQTGCDAGENCYPGSGDGVTQCFAPSTSPVALGEICEYLNDCPAGAGCFGVDESGSTVYRCMAFCDTADGAADCGGSTSCQAVDGLPSGTGVCPPT